jgi:hypothetical protein
MTTIMHDRRHPPSPADHALFIGLLIGLLAGAIVAR